MIDNNKLLEKFHGALEVKGYKGQVVSSKHIPELTKDIHKYYKKKLLDPDFYQEYKMYFEIKPEVDFSQLNSIFVIAVPQPQFKVTFQRNNKELSLIIPPTYLHSRAIIKQIKEILLNLLNPAGFSKLSRISFICLIIARECK